MVTMPDTDTSQPVNTVRKRAVLYIPGYDPFPPRRYRELYRTESASQAALSGYDLQLGPRAGAGFGWSIEAEIEGAQVQTDIQVLVWSDLVRKSMNPPIPVTYALLVKTAWIYLSTGALFRLARLRKGPLIAALLPAVLLLGQLLIALLLGAGAAKGVSFALAWAQPAGVGVGIETAARTLVWAGVTWLALRWFKARDGKVFAYYLMHDYAFSSGLYGETPPVLEARMAAFGEQIVAALQSDVDEVLIVGHSSGAHLAVSILADLLRAGRLPTEAGALSLLTLGQVIPMLSFLPKATKLRADLHDLSCASEITWVDVTAPGDGCAFALCDPVAVSGVAPAEGKRWPLVLSAAFTQTLSPERQQELKRRYFRLHFQYLCAFDRPGSYDYFRITAGPQTLASRFAHRKPSASRIETPLSPHTERAFVTG